MKSSIIPSLLSLLIAVPITISWRAADGEQKGFKVYWGTGNGVFENSVDVKNVLEYSRAYDFATPTTKLCFAVAAYNDVGETKKSSQICKTGPGIPFGLTVREGNP